MELLYNTGEKLRAVEAMRIARELLVKDDKLDLEECNIMRKYTPLSIKYMEDKEDKSKECIAVGYKDICVEFHKVDKK
jgi:hypothetical protein